MGSVKYVLTERDWEKIKEEQIDQKEEGEMGGSKMTERPRTKRG